MDTSKVKPSLMPHCPPPPPPRDDSGDDSGDNADTRKSYYDELSIDVLARTIWGEARGEGSTGMQAVACVILNRVKIARKMAGYWWGKDIIDVCQKPYQFSCWNKSDPNFKVILDIDQTNLEFNTAMRIARRAVHNVLTDITRGATHYHAAGISPFWSKNNKPVTVIGNHIFYKLVEA